MTNAKKFKQIFGIYATELWAMSEEEFLAWLNAEAKTEDWIPCKDTLPEENDEYMVTWRTSDSKKPFINILEFDSTDGWILEDYMKTYRNVVIVAWRPTPELYKGD